MGFELLRPQIQKIDWSRPINRGLIGAWLLNEQNGGLAWDISGKNNHGTLTDSPVWAGQGLKFDGVNTGVEIGAGIRPSLPVTIHTRCKFNSLPTTGGLFSADKTETSTSFHSGFLVAHGFITAGKISVNYGSNTANDSTGRRTKTGATTPALGVEHSITCVIRGATDMTIWLNGVDDGGTYAGTGGAMVYKAFNGSIGKFHNTGAGAKEAMDGFIFDCRVWGRALSDLEVKMLHLNPDAGLYQSSPARYYVAATGAYAIDAAAGVYSLTGPGAGVLSGRMVNAAIGAYDITGAAAGALAGRMISADPGGYALTGVAAGAVASRILSADAGAYALTGSPAAVVAARVLSGDPGSYIITGIDAGLIYTSAGAYSLDAAPGSYAVTGVASWLLAARMIGASPGAYSITGQQAATIADRILGADAGALQVTGAEAAALVARAIGAMPGEYLIDGAGATLTGPALTAYLLSFRIPEDRRDILIKQEPRSFNIQDSA